MFHFNHQITLLCLFNFAVVPIFAQRPKILCLHGGGGTGAGFSGEVRDLENALPQYEFVYADGGYGNDGGGGRLWIRDPPGGKGEPTTDPAFSDDSIAALDALRESEGPFAGILGYSQGAAYVPVYLSRVPENTFDFAVMFCGYPTETHQGILEVVEEQSPFGGVSSLIWIGEQDSVIPPILSRGLIDFFDSPTVISSPQGGHFVPWSSEPTFPSVVSFIASNGDGGDPVPTPSLAPNSVPSPTLAPVAKPSDKPIGDEPTSPTLAPVAKPSGKPIGDKPTPDGDDCFNKDLAFKGKEKFNCVWVGKKPHIRCPKVWKGYALSEYCPVSCNKCGEDSDDDKDDDKDEEDDDVTGCVDDPAFQFKNKPKKNCSWVATKPAKLCKKKWKGTRISDSCPVTCGACVRRHLRSRF